MTQFTQIIQLKAQGPKLIVAFNSDLSTMCNIFILKLMKMSAEWDIDGF